MSMQENASPEAPADNPAEDLDAFAADFYGQKPSEPDPEPASSEEVEVTEEESDANEEDTHLEDDTLADEEDEDEEDKGEPEPPKKSRFQERIDKLTGEAREAQRREQALRAEFEALKSQLTEPKTPQIKNTETVNTGPTPDELNEDGTEKYPLGEFDPQFVRDLTKHVLKEEREALKAEEARIAEQKELDTQKTALAAEWQTKLAPAKERYPDFEEKGLQLTDTFADIDPAYGEYLTSTIMSLEAGPEVLYYLANNIELAEQIVKSGPAKATIALGRLEAKFATEDEVLATTRPKVTKAPAPPTALNKGSSAVKPGVSVDTDDLDAFAKVFYKQRGS